MSRSFHSVDEVRLACFTYIEGFYNIKRSHGTLDMLTPYDSEKIIGIVDRETFDFKLLDPLFNYAK